MARIIAAEDDELVAEILRAVLIDSGHAIGVVSNGDDALRIIKAMRPHLAILDCNLPGMSGVDILRNIRLDPDLWDLPAIMLTGRQSAADKEVAAYAGASHYVTKPFDPQKLAFLIEDTLKDDAIRRRLNDKGSPRPLSCAA